MSKQRYRYANMGGVERMNTLGDMLQWRKERKAKRKDLSFVVPQAPSEEIERMLAAGDEPTVTWIGHSTFLMRLGGLWIATDPVWAESMGFMKRLAAPGVPLEKLPPIDVVLISHGHYDHLDFPTLRRIRAKGQPLVLVPHGLAGKMRRKGFSRVQELAWWEDMQEGSVTFTFVPAQHWTRRTPWDTNSSHWGGWVLRDGSRTVYFAGDSGYFGGFAQIGAKYKPDYVLMPIGAYEPEWFMKLQHVSPEEAVQAFVDTGGHYMIPMHYGAFRLADDTPKEALNRLYTEWGRRLLDPDRLLEPVHGGTVWLK
ncbi:MBL fold metallo-hydrolase [Paenibacillus sp. MBLB4367]|uniref:MBL fold metallo-hydrolase n=1 Tax=Paenibacillus sp. MBLB4367 TaxID=3384767 RepID=UPI003907EC6E